jgi:hypothetical protein
VLSSLPFSCCACACFGLRDDIEGSGRAWIDVGQVEVCEREVCDMYT